MPVRRTFPTNFTCVLGMKSYELCSLSFVLYEFLSAFVELIKAKKTICPTTTINLRKAAKNESKNKKTGLCRRTQSLYYRR